MTRIPIVAYLAGLNIHSARGICRGMSLRPFFAILIAFAMSFAPFSMPNDSAMAAAPASHHGQITMEQDRCDGQTANGQSGNGGTKDTGMPCCVAMCAAIAANPVVPVEPVAFARVADTQTIEQFGPSFLTELATPPPRRA